VRLVEASGNAHTRGRTVGGAFAGAIDGTLDFNRRYVTSRGVEASDLEPLLAPYLAASREALPGLVEYLEGVAEGAERPFLEVFLANAFEEVYGILELGTPAPVGLERCSRTTSSGTRATQVPSESCWRSPTTAPRCWPRWSRACLPSSG
jgi:hypothetical protein